MRWFATQPLGNRVIDLASTSADCQACLERIEVLSAVYFCLMSMYYVAGTALTID